MLSKLRFVPILFFLFGVGTFLSCATKPKVEPGDPWYRAARKGDLDEIDRQLKQGKSINFVNDIGVSVLMVAAQNGQVETAKALIQRGADAALLDKDRQSALAYALTGRAQDEKRRLLTEVILKAGGNPFVIDRVGFQPIREMIDSGYDDLLMKVNYSNEKPCDRLERVRGEASLSQQARRLGNPALGEFFDKQGCW